MAITVTELSEILSEVDEELEVVLDLSSIYDYFDSEHKHGPIDFDYEVVRADIDPVNQDEDNGGEDYDEDEEHTSKPRRRKALVLRLL